MKRDEKCFRIFSMTKFTYGEVQPEERKKESKMDGLRGLMQLEGEFVQLRTHNLLTRNSPEISFKFSMNFNCGIFKVAFTWGLFTMEISQRWRWGSRVERNSLFSFRLSHEVMPIISKRNGTHTHAQNINLYGWGVKWAKASLRVNERGIQRKTLAQDVCTWICSFDRKNSRESDCWEA